MLVRSLDGKWFRVEKIEDSQKSKRKTEVRMRNNGIMESEPINVYRSMDGNGGRSSWKGTERVTKFSLRLE